MRIKTIRRRIPATREDRNDSFRVNFKDRNTFDQLQVIVTRLADQSEQTFYFPSSSLPNRDSIHFTAAVVAGKLRVTWRKIQPLLIPEPIIMELNPDWFRSGYYVYVVTIQYKRKKYFYVGMTGDRHHLTARSPFYRMNGHFIRGKSTQNQIVKGIEDKLGLEVTDELLAQMSFIYYAWLLHPFHANDEQNHMSRRVYGEGVENALISIMRKNFGDNAVFNKRVSSINNPEYALIAQQIFDNIIR